MEFRVVREAARVDPEWAVIEVIWNELSTPYSPDQRLYELSSGQRALYSLHWIRSEVANGGFHQCFWNPTGYLLPEAVAGAELLEAPEWSLLLGEAERLFPPPYPRAREDRQELLGRLAEDDLRRMDLLDERLFDLEDSDATSLDVLFRRYIERHPDEFFVPAPSEEDACKALLDGARRLVNEPPPRRLDLADELLREAAERSRRSGTGRVAVLAESLLSQLPDLRA
jgi:hypothetical protein